jgi:hypothetical protein
MSGRSEASRRALGAGLALGVLGMILLRDGGAPGLDAWACIVALAGATAALQHRAGRTFSAESRIWLGVAVASGLALLWRDAGVLRLLALWCACVAFVLPAFHSGAAWLRRGRVEEYVGAFISAGLAGARGPALALRDAHVGRAVREGGGSPAARVAGAVVLGATVAVPPLVVFGALLSAADVMFADMLGRVLRFDTDRLAADLVLTLVIGWVAAGYLYGFTAASRTAGPRAALPFSLGSTEVGIALGLLNLLFLAFVAVQVRYLLGGASLVELTPGLTYAEYARRGFFELVAAVALVVPLLLAADAVRRRRSRTDDALFRSLAGLQVLLVLCMAVSALERMRLYYTAYGLTGQRVYATAALVLVVAVLVWLAATVLRGRRRAFGYGALLASFGMAALLFVVNPDALVARTNIARSAHVDEAPQLDVRYTASLSADAVPVLLKAIPVLAPAARCVIADRILRRWGAQPEPAWQQWNWSDARARRAVASQRAMLNAHTDEAECAATLAPRGAA